MIDPKTFTRAQWTILGIALTVCVVAFVIVHSIPHPQPLPERDQRALDSMRVTQHTYDAARDTLIQRETVFVSQVDTLLARAHSASVAADRLQHVADSLAQIANDAVSLWRDAYIARTTEADSLRSAMLLAFAAETTEHQARMLADARATVADRRVTALTELNNRLAMDIRHATECKFLWMRCPSRTTIALTSVAAGLVAGYTIHQ